jgi:hypothetical protein
MATFPDELPDWLPPEGQSIGFKYFIYLGLIYMVLTAFTSWIITRRRPKGYYDDEYEDDDYEDRETEVQLGMTKTLTFDDTRDLLSSLKIEIAGAEASLAKLNSEKALNEISDDAFTNLSDRYSQHVTKISQKMNRMISTSIRTREGDIAEGIPLEQGISQAEMADIEADLQKQLVDLESDEDFLKTGRPKTPISEVYKQDPLAPPPKAAPPAQPAASPPAAEQMKAPSPKPPPPSSQEAQPPAKSAAPPPSPVKVETPVKPQPVSTKVEKPPPPQKVEKKAPAPSPPPSSVKKMPPPPAKPEIAPTDDVRVATPIAAQQPMKVESEEGEEKIFAKSTSIAALRMDMLRELARLKKLISEDDK